MNHRKKIIVSFFLYAIVFGFAYIIWLYLKNHQIVACISLENCPEYNFYMSVLKPLLTFLPFITGILVLLLFFSEKVFTFWKKCALAMIVLMAVHVSLTPIFCSGYICFDKESVARGDSWFFGILSVAIIVISAVVYKIKLKNKTA
jgi:hypothetical protein